MHIKRAVRVVVISVLLGTQIAGCSTAPAFEQSLQTHQPQPVITTQSAIIAPSDIELHFSRSEVATIAAPPKPVVEAPEPAKTTAPLEAPKPVPAAPVAPKAPVPVVTVPAPAVQPPVTAAPVQEVVPKVAPPPVHREVYVGLAGGQETVDLGRGPVLFPLPGGYPPYVAEHDFQGGWARFGTLEKGMTVRMSGLVTGTYTVGEIINVPKKGKTSELKAFHSMPKVMLQTCIPGTNRMIVVGLF